MISCPPAFCSSVYIQASLPAAPAAAIPFSPLLSFSVFAIAACARVSTCRVHASHATNTHKHTQKVWLCPTFYRCQEDNSQRDNSQHLQHEHDEAGRGGEERRIIYSVTSPSMAASLILLPPSLYTSLPISHSRTFYHLSYFFCLFFLYFCLYSFSFLCSTKLPPSFSFTFISPLPHFSLLVSSLKMPGLISFI